MGAILKITKNMKEIDNYINNNTFDIYINNNTLSETHYS